MEALVQLLLTLVNKVPFLSEAEKEGALDQLRKLETFLGVEGVVPPKAVDTNQAAAVETPVVDPGPVAEPVPPAEQVPPPTSPDVAPGDVEASNAFAQTDAAEDVPGSP